MTRTHLFAMVVAVVAGTSACRGWDSPLPPVHLNPNMDTQEKGKGYRASDFFKDGRSMRTPPAGTVARGYLHEDDARTLGIDPNDPSANSADPKPTFNFPGGVASWEPKLARGDRQFHIYCAPCHGAAGDGQGLVAAKMTVKPPSFLDQRLKDFPIGKIYRAETYGVNAGNMGSYAAQLSEDDRWAVAYYVRSLQRATDPKVEWEGGKIVVIAPITVATAEVGAQLYEAKGCNACHTVDGSAKVGPSWKGIFGKSEATSAGAVTVDAAYIIESIQNPNAKVVNGFPPAMPPRPDLTQLELDSLVKYIETLK